MDEYSARIRSDLTNKYVHIRDMVSELKAYKAKPMKQVIPTIHDVGLDDGCPAVKRTKMEPVSWKQELPCVMEESFVSCKSVASRGLPALLRQSSNLCQFVPLSAMPCSKSADVDLSDCRVVDVLADDTDSRSSFDDGSSSQPATVTDGSHVTDEVNDGTKVVVNSVDSTVNCGKGLLVPVEEKGSWNPLSTSEQHSLKLDSSFAVDQREMAEVTERAKNDHSEPVAHCSVEQHKSTSDSGEAKSKLASARRIRYLETLLLV